MNTRRNNSIKRRAVYDALRAAKEHPTAEMLYSGLKLQYPKMSLGTVYRNLQVLVQERMAVKVAHVDGQERYDARTEPHAHLICRNCSRVFDLELDENVMDNLRAAGESDDFSPDGFQLSYSGVCADCASKRGF